MAFTLLLLGVTVFDHFKIAVHPKVLLFALAWSILWDLLMLRRHVLEGKVK